jgi:hypothetical protein
MPKSKVNASTQEDPTTRNLREANKIMGTKWDSILDVTFFTEAEHKVMLEHLDHVLGLFTIRGASRGVQVRAARLQREVKDWAYVD